MDLEQLRHMMEELIPFNRYLGMRVGGLSRGFLRLELDYRDELVGDFARGALHGGVLSTLADTAGGGAVWSEVDDEAGRVSTIDLRIDYLRPGQNERIICEARVVRRGNRVGVADMVVFHPGQKDEPIAVGKGVYNITIVKPRT